MCSPHSHSVRGPRAGGRDRAPEPYGLEAREFLRKKLIGKEVTVKMEYTRKIGFQPGQAEQAPAVPGQEVCVEGCWGGCCWPLEAVASRGTGSRAGAWEDVG